ncbi:MAG: type II toxin-antitoxin system death-on-curing family toxin [Patescibacteria group bacterium]
MAKVRFLTLEQVLATHHFLIENYGGSHGVRDLKMLESSVYRPQAFFGGKFLFPTIFEKAAALMCPLIQNRPFLDGNKRTAVVSSAAFLELNGWALRASPEDIYKTAVSIAVSKLSVEEVSIWLNSNSINVK